MITGQYYDQKRGATLPAAIAYGVNLQLETEPFSKLRFNCKIWGSMDEFQAGNGPYEHIVALELKGGPDEEGMANIETIVSLFAAWSRVNKSQPVSDDDIEEANGMITGAHVLMDGLLLEMPQFAGWSRI